MMMGEAYGVRSGSSFWWTGCKIVHVMHVLGFDGVDIIELRQLKLKID